MTPCFLTALFAPPKRDTGNKGFNKCLLATELRTGINSFLDCNKYLLIFTVAIVDRLDSPVTSVPGVGMVYGAVILSEIEDIHRFPSDKQLVSYAGIDAPVHESGECQATQTHMSKRGSPYLRSALWGAAFVASHSDPDLSDYCQRLRARGKHHNFPSVLSPESSGISSAPFCLPTDRLKSEANARFCVRATSLFSRLCFQLHFSCSIFKILLSSSPWLPLFLCLYFYLSGWLDFL